MGCSIRAWTTFAVLTQLNRLPTPLSAILYLLYVLFVGEHMDSTRCGGVFRVSGVTGAVQRGTEGGRVGMPLT